ncbi:Hypothetical predicted protein, partial [Pelobates cultripes]
IPNDPECCDYNTLLQKGRWAEKLNPDKPRPGANIGNLFCQVQGAHGPKMATGLEEFTDSSDNLSLQDCSG